MSPQDSPLIRLENVPGYQYPLPPGTVLPTMKSRAEVVYSNRYDIIQWPQVQLDQKTIVTFEAVGRPPAVLVMPFNEKGEIMLVETTHPGAKPYVGYIAGDVEPDNDVDIIEAGKREFLQEVGYEADDMNIVYFHYFLPRSQHFAYTLFAKNIRKVCEPISDHGEKCVPFFVTIDQLVTMTRQKKFLYPPALIVDLILAEKLDILPRMIANPSAFDAMGG